MKQLALIVIVVACHRSEPVATPPPAAAPVPPLDQPTAMTRWRALAPTGATVNEALAKIPGAERAAMLFALIRDGNITCTRTMTECGMTFADEPRDTEGLDAPCLRRRLVESLVRDIDGHIAVPTDVLAAVAKQDRDLVNAFTDIVEDNAIVDFLVAAEAAGTELYESELVGRSHEVIVDAARRHVDEGVSGLSTYDEADRDLLIAAIADTEVSPRIRAAIISTLPLRSSKPLIAALEAAVREPSCNLSGNAAVALAKLGDRRWLPKPPAQHDPEAYFREACRLTRGDFYDDEWAPIATAFAPKGGILFIAPRGQPYGFDNTPVRQKLVYDFEVTSLLSELAEARCDARTCIVEPTRYDLAWSGNVLSRVTVHRNVRKEKLEQDKAAAMECDIGGGD